MFETEEIGDKQELRALERRYLVFYLRVFDGLSNRILGHLVDISERGIMLLSDSPIEVNENYRLRMRLPTEMKDRNEIIFAATSRWCKTDTNPEFYRAGFQMHNVNPYTKKLISRLINDFGYES